MSDSYYKVSNSFVKDKLLRFGRLFDRTSSGDDSMKKFISEPYVDMLLHAFTDSIDIINNRISNSNYLFNRRILKQAFKFLFLPKPSVMLLEVNSRSEHISFCLPESTEFNLIDSGNKYVFTSISSMYICNFEVVSSCFKSSDDLDLVGLKGQFIQVFLKFKSSLSDLYNKKVDLYINHPKSSDIILGVINSSSCKVYLLFDDNSYMHVGTAKPKKPGILLRSRSFVTSFLNDVCCYFMMPEIFNFFTVEFDQNVNFDRLDDFSILIETSGLRLNYTDFVHINVVPLVNLYNTVTSSYKYHCSTCESIFIDYSVRRYLMIYDLLTVYCVDANSGHRMLVRSHGESVDSDCDGDAISDICWEYEFDYDKQNNLLLSRCYLLFNGVDVSSVSNYVFYGKAIATQLVDRILITNDIYLPKRPDLSVDDVIIAPTYTYILDDSDFSYTDKAFNIMSISGIDLIHKPTFKKLFESLIRSFSFYFSSSSVVKISDSVLKDVNVIKNVAPVVLSNMLGNVNALVYRILVHLNSGILGNLVFPFISMFSSFIETNMSFNTFFEVVFVDSVTFSTILIKRNF